MTTTLTAIAKQTAALEQLGRYWEEHTLWSGGLRFVEANELAGAFTDAAGAIFAGPLPDIGKRLATAVSLTLAPSVPPPASLPASSIGVRLEAVAPSSREAIALLTDLRELARPGGRIFVAPNLASTGAFDLDAVIGPPPPQAFEEGVLPDYLDDDTTLGVWRIRRIDVVSEPQPVEFGDGAEGQHTARMQVQLMAVRAAMPEPLPAFEVYHDGSGGVTAAGVTSYPSDARLAFRVESTAGVHTAAVNHSAGDMTDLRAAIALLGGIDARHEGWTIQSIDTDLDARPASDLCRWHRLDALTVDNARPVAVNA